MAVPQVFDVINERISAATRPTMPADLMRPQQGADFMQPSPAPAPPVAAPVSGFDAQLGSFMAAIRQQESSDNYEAVGPSTSYGRAKGAYQILEGNWGAWAAEAGVPGARWDDPEAQDRVAAYKMSQYYRQFGSWEAVAVAWFAGPGRAADYAANPNSVGGLEDVLGMSVTNYVAKAINGMGQTGGAVPAAGAPPAPPTPAQDGQPRGAAALMAVLRQGLGNFVTNPGMGNFPQASSSPVTGPEQAATPTGEFATPTGENGRLNIDDLTDVDGQGHYLAPQAADSWMRMVADAAADGVTITVGNSYRDYETQVQLAEEKGLYSQGGLAAEPGTSKHGLGLAVDIVSNDAAIAWLREHAAEYGFEGIDREPWHWSFGGG